MLDRHDYLNPATVPPLGKVETSYPTPNLADRVVIERVEIKSGHYAPIPPHSPHESYDTTGLFLVWQGKVKAENNQVVAVRVYANDTAQNEDWYNANIKYAGDVRTFPVYVRSYIELRENYSAAVQGSALTRTIRLRVISGGTYTSAPTVTITPAGAGTAPTANAIMNPAKTHVIGLELLTPGTGLVANPVVSFSGGGQTVAATATAEIQLAGTVLVHEETNKLDSEDRQMASLFIKVHRVYETLPGPLLVWDIYDGNDRGAVQRTSQSILASDVTGAAIGSEAATFTRSGTYPNRVITKTWFEPRGDSAIVLTKLVETWDEVVKDDLSVTSEFGGGILSRTERTDEPGAQQPESGFLVVSSKQETVSPHEQKTITEKLDPSSATPVLELVYGGLGYATPPTLSFVSGTGGGAAGTSTLGFGIASVAVTDQGDGNYTHPPTVGFINGGGGGAFALATIGFALASAIVTNPGSLYTSPPGLTVTGDGTGATATAVLGFGVYFASVTDPGGRATQTLTSDNTNVANNDTVTIGSKVYTFKTALTPTEGEVLRGASADASLLNLISAINHTGTPNTDYKCAAANTQVTASAAVVAHAFSVTAIAPGTAGNSIVTTETSAHLSWGASTLVGGFSYTEIPATIIEGGGGSGALGNVIMGHPVSTISVVLRGTSYETAPDVAVGVGNGSGLIATAVLAFAVASITVSTPGAYASVPTVTIGPPETGGVQATATAVLSYGIASITVTNGGTTYTSAPTVGFGAGSGSGATGTAVLGYALATAVIDDPGTAYTSFPSFVFSGGGGTGATVNIRMGLLTAAVVSGGTGYAVDDILDIVGGTHTTVGQVHVTAVSGGVVTAVSIETAGVYSAISSNPRTSVGGGASPTTVTRTYVSDGDINGVIYYLGTNFGTAGWTNPHTAGRCTFIRSSNLNGLDSDLCNHATDYNTTDNGAGEWVAVDIGPNRDVIVSDYLIQNGAADGINAPSNWELQGSTNVATNDIAGVNAATWVAIDSRSSDTTIAQTIGSWGHFTLGSTPAAYRWFRIVTTGVNRAGLNYLQMSELELYGDLDYIASGTGATFNLTYQLVQVNITAVGTGFTSVPTIAIASGGGVTATAHFTLASTGSVKSVTITAPGTGYTAPFALSFTSGGGSGAAATATPGGAGVLDHFTITEPGRGYITPPTITLTGAGGGVGTAVLETSGELWRIDVLSGGVFEGSAPTILISGGGGSGATATSVLDTTLNYVHRVHIGLPGHRYSSAPTIRFEYSDGTVPVGLAATTTLLTTGGEVTGVTITSGGTGYSTATIVFNNAGHGGSGASADAVFAITGKITGITVLQPGLYRTLPDVVLEGGGGTGAEALATLASTGSVISILLTAAGLYTVAPTVVFTGSHTALATALYHIGSDEWPANHGFNTDPTNGIVIDHVKKTVPEGTPYPGRRPFPDYSGPFIDMSTYDRWKSIQIASSVDLQTLPPPETFPVWHGLHLAPRLLAIRALWSDRISKSVSALKSSAAASVSTGLTGDIVIKSSEGFHGSILGFGNRVWFLGPPPLGAIPPRVDIIGSSGSVILTETSSATHDTQFDDGGVSFGDSFNHIVRATDIRDHIIIPGGYTIENESQTSLPQIASAQSGGGSFVGVFAAGTQSFLTVDLQPSNPGYDIRGHTLLVDVQPEKWRFNLWQLTLVYVTIPYNT